tara:strand:- start:730 stop:1137 length:408 start_codon:yes stop_codon:yes gene_type:complete
MIIDQSLQTFALWTGFNLGLTLFLALNVTRLRTKEGIAVGFATSQSLERAIRAHGNNIEYVPLALLGILVLVHLGYSPMTINLLGGLLFVARICHAYGIQQQDIALPKTRVIGNILTWITYIILTILLIFPYINN